ncbi:MAG: hypothetical protein IPG47_07010 [Thermoflexaceae bacterium]|nr:hypothetical protein [Thermoflexaceae bacterium]
MSATVRPATPADGAAIYAAWLAIREHYAATDTRVQNAPVTETEFLAGLRDTIARDTTCAMVAEAEGNVIGFVSGESNSTNRTACPKSTPPLATSTSRPATGGAGSGGCWLAR